MLISKKDRSSKRRLCCDLRALNDRIIKVNYPYPLLDEALEQIGEQKPTVLSCLDVKDAFFSLNLAKESQKFCGISAYHNSKSYYFIRLPQGLSVSPSHFSRFLTKILAEIPNHKTFVASYMDDLLIFSKNEEEHQQHIAQVLEALITCGLKISPKKSLFFRDKVDHLGHTIEIIDGKPHTKIQRSKIEAIVRLKVPRTLKQLRGFCGMVNYLTRYVPRLNDLLRPIRRLTRKNTRYKWSEECQYAFDKIKELICKAPVLTLPNKEGLIRVYVDTSNTGVGCTVFQCDLEDPEKENLICYFSKTLEEPVKRYSVTETEGHGLCVALLHLKFLKSRTFEVYTDHSALVHMMKATTEIPTPRLKRQFEKLKGTILSLFTRKELKWQYVIFLAEQNLNQSIWRRNTLRLVTTRAQAKEQEFVPEIKKCSRTGTNKES